MPIPSYDELKLRLDPLGDRTYRVTAFGPDGSTASGRFTSPVSELELDNFILRVARPRVVRAAHAPELDEAKELGGALFDSLLCDDVGDVYQGARKVAESQRRGLRITLSMTDAPELLEIPWELLYDPGAASFLSDSIYTPVVRTLDLKSPPAAPELTLPFKVLGVVSSPEGFPPLDTQSEREKLETALASLIEDGAVELEWLEPSTLAELDRRIGAPDDLHVIHYIGHGAYDKRTRGGILALEDAHGDPHEVSGDELGRYMKDERSLRLVVLNSCEGARASHVDPFSGVATSLLRCGLPAVIGMQAEITDEAAIAFSDRLYTALAQGYPIDAALAQARKAIAAAKKGVEFSTPVLFMRVSDGRIFNVTGVLPAAAVRPAPAMPARQAGRIEPVLRAEPESVTAGGTVTWRLEITNAGSGRVSNVTARDRDGELRAGPMDLKAGATHECSWTETVDDEDVEELVAVEGRGADGRPVTAEVAGRVTVRGGGGGGPSGRAILIGAGALAAVVVVAVLALGVLGGGDDDGDRPPPGPDVRAFTVGTGIPDVDARGDKVAFYAIAENGATDIQRLDVDRWEAVPVAPAVPKRYGMDVGLTGDRRTQLVYTGCQTPTACDIFRRSFSGPELPLAVSTPECSESRPSMWTGLLLFDRRGGTCGAQLMLGRVNSGEAEPIAGNTAGADMNDGTIVWLDPADGALVARSVDAGGTVDDASRLTPPAGDQFLTPIVVEGEYVYFGHAQGSAVYIARAELPLSDGAEIEHYKPGDEVPEAEEKPHFAVTGDTLYVSNYPQPNGRSGFGKILRVRDPVFVAAE